MVGAYAQGMPVARTWRAVAAAISRTSAVSRMAPRPMLWGKRVAPYTLLCPCTASVPQMTGTLTAMSVAIEAS